MPYPMTYERYHVTTSAQTAPTVCHSLPIALQLLSSLPVGTVARVERVVETHVVYDVYGTAENPLPAPPASPISTHTMGISHIVPGQ